MKKEQYLQLFTRISKITLICSIVAVALFFFLKNIPTTANSPKIAPTIAQDIQYIQSEIKAGRLTESESEAKIKLMELLKQQKATNEKLNDGSIDSILKKIGMNDPTAAKAFRQKIVEAHGEAGLKK